MLWFGLFEMSELWMWLILVSGVIAVTAFVDVDRPGAATTTVLGVLLLLHMGHIVNVFSLFHSPGAVIEIVLAYLLIGVLWAVMKWMFHLDHWKRESISVIRSLKRDFMERMDMGGETIPPELSEEWAAFVSKSDFYVDTGRYRATRVNLGKAPSVADNKGRLITWGVYWPFSMVWTIINDPVKRFYQYVIIHVLGGFMQRLADKKELAVKRELGGS